MKINGKDFPISFGLNQSVLYCELRKINITQMNEDFKKMANNSGNGSELRDLIWSSLKDGARKNNIDFPYTNYDVGDWVEKADEKEMEMWVKEFSNSLPKVREENNKKKVKKN
jgi:hypothetical protein